jgi:copper chaperone NosL
MALAGALLLVVAFFTFRKGRQLRREEQSQAARAAVPALAALLAGTAIFLSSCSAGPAPIQVGKDNCDFCRMGIADARFGAEVMNKKGKAWKFDDVHCLLGFLKEGSLKADDIRDVYFTRFDGDHALLASGKALLLQSEALHSPMGGNVAAFAERADLDSAMQQFGGQEISWDALRQQ